MTNLAEASCAAPFEAGMSAILVEQGETADVAAALAARASRRLAAVDLGPRPFVVGSSSGADYGFFIQKKDERCLIRLYGRWQGFTSYTNNLTYISTRELPGCACHE